MTSHQVILPVFGGPELLCAAFHQALILKQKRCSLHPQGWGQRWGGAPLVLPGPQSWELCSLGRQLWSKAPQDAVSPTMSCLSDRIWNKESCHSRMWMSSRCPEGKARLQKEHVCLCRVW